VAVELQDVMRTCVAVREFSDGAVSDETLHRILSDARFAPSGGNRQGWRVIVVKDDAVRRGLRELSMEGWREYAAHIEQGFVPFAPGADGRWNGPAVDLAAAAESAPPNPFVENLHLAPALLAVVADLGALAVLDVDADHQSIVGGGSIYPFVQNLMLRAREEGLGGVITTYACRRHAAAADLLHLPRGFALAAVIPLGRPVRSATRLRRRPVEEFTSVDTLDGPAFEAPAELAQSAR
jgi:nitroreductase